MTNVFSEEKPEVLDYIEKLEKNNHIDPELFDKYKVNRGLRDLNGNGVLTGLTETVSYTHLDVYKRQAQNRRKGLFAQTGL